MRRRQFIVRAGLSATAFLAGCSEKNTSSTTVTTQKNTPDPAFDPATPLPATLTPVADSTMDETATQTQITLQTQQQKTSNRRSDADYSTGWTFPAATGTHSVVSPGLQGTEYALKFDGFQKGHLTGALQHGKRFAFSFKPTNYSGAPSLIRFQFACSGEGDENIYQIEFEGSNTSGSDWSLEKFSNGTQASVDVAGDGVGTTLGEEYRVEVDWNTGDTDITARWYNPDGTLRSTPLSITDSEYTQPGVCLMCNSNVTVLWDGIQSLRS
jgi:hypothetical protein